MELGVLALDKIFGVVGVWKTGKSKSEMPGS
jgi:hypothetical protein